MNPNALLPKRVDYPVRGVGRLNPYFLQFVFRPVGQKIKNSNWVPLSPSIELAKLAGLGFAGEHQLAYRVITTKCPHETDGGPYCAHRAIRRDLEKENVVAFEKKKILKYWYPVAPLPQLYPHYDGESHNITCPDF